MSQQQNKEAEENQKTSERSATNTENDHTKIMASTDKEKNTETTATCKYKKKCIS